ncbi:MAG TPA: hypothetical protein VNJ02_06450 [Vicinamibacterales bacterium]|nr:hypothetical protein [Vicinamibacterales bacterium]
MYASRQIARFAVVALVAVSLAGCDIAVNGDGGLHFDVSAGKAQDEWTRSYRVPASGRLEIINVNGKITAVPSDTGSIEIRAERSAKGATDDGAKELLARIEMREEIGEGRVRVEVRAPRINGPSRHEIKWTIKVPRGVAVDLRTVNGGVKMDGLEGEIRARSTNGGITGTGLIATGIDAAVTNGGVEIDLAKAITSGTFDIEAVNGGVTFNMPADSQADLSGRCVNGGVSVTGLEVEKIGEETRRRMDAKLNGGGARVSLETTNGGVKFGRSGGTT